MGFDNKVEVEQFDREMSRATSDLREKLSFRVGINQCYYEGAHWINANVRGAGGKFFVGRLPLDHTPESEHLRVQTNDLTRLTQKVAADTRPSHLPVDILPPDGEWGITDEASMETHESLVSAVIADSGLVETAQTANDERPIAGTWGIGFTLKYTLQDGSRSDAKMIAFDFHPAQLIVEPDDRSWPLWKHEWVGFEDIWTVRKIRTWFPHLFQGQLDESQFKKIRDLDTVRHEISAISGGRLYAHHHSRSEARGAKVRQWHVRDGDDRFERMFVVVELPDARHEVVNFDNPETPFGGIGMPLDLLRAHHRSDVSKSVAMSDVDMFRVDQDKINLGETLYQRIKQRYAGPMTVVDRKAFGGDSDEKIRAQFSNMIGKILVANLSGKGRGDQPVPPQQITPPPPSGDIRESIREYQDSMRENAHKAPGSLGDVKTHVTSSAFHRALDEAGSVTDARVNGDVGAYTRIAETMRATAVRLVQQKNPSTLRMLKREGFGSEDFTELVREDWRRPRYSVQVRDEAVRVRSHRQRQQDLDAAADRQMIDPLTYRIAKTRDLQTPLFSTDSQMVRSARKSALRVMAGEPWEPLSLGEYNRLFMDEFRRAALEARRRGDREAQARLTDAIRMQLESQREEILASDPKLADGLEQSAHREGEGAAAQGNVTAADLIASLLPAGTAT